MHPPAPSPFLRTRSGAILPGSAFSLVERGITCRRFRVKWVGGLNVLRPVRAGFLTYSVAERGLKGAVQPLALWRAGLG